MKTKMFVLGALALVGCLVGCGAATPVPADKLARAQETVRIAEAAPTAMVDPKAAQHLQLAKEQLQHGKKLMIDGDNDEAKWVLMRAQADGEVAVYQAQAQAAKADAQATLDAIKQAMSMMKEGGGS
ncbi:MAG TPA: DUF4398 domain-containing protein [Labilithrix sp.]|nr:DUF4398 domain-containing protein [Labilithrix sp.]